MISFYDWCTVTYECPHCEEDGVTMTPDSGEIIDCSECGNTCRIEPDADCDEDGLIDCTTVHKHEEAVA